MPPPPASRNQTAPPSSVKHNLLLRSKKRKNVVKIYRLRSLPRKENGKIRAKRVFSLGTPSFIFPPPFYFSGKTVEEEGVGKRPPSSPHAKQALHFRLFPLTSLKFFLAKKKLFFPRQKKLLKLIEVFLPLLLSHNIFLQKKSGHLLRASPNIAFFIWGKKIREHKPISHNKRTRNAQKNWKESRTLIGQRTASPKMSPVASVVYRKRKRSCRRDNCLGRS